MGRESRRRKVRTHGDIDSFCDANELKKAIRFKERMDKIGLETVQILKPNASLEIKTYDD